jgi:hypothetical protein
MTGKSGVHQCRPLIMGYLSWMVEDTRKKPSREGLSPFNVRFSGVRGNGLQMITSFVVEIPKPIDFRVDIWQDQNRRRSKGPLPMPAKKPSLNVASPLAILAIPELQHAKAAVLGTLVSLRSRRAYKNAIDKFIA